ncbi:MAG: PAS domain-containing protein [Chloroflexota bacterium]
MSHTHWSDFLTKLPIGYYRLDAEDKVDYANHAWLALHGYPSLEYVQGKKVSLAYVHEEDAKALQDTIMACGTIHDRVIELKRPDGEHFWASIYASAIQGPDGDYFGREGIVIDVTERQIQRRIADTLPAGYYAVEIKDGCERITHCNKEFVEMFGFDSEAHAVGFEIHQLYRYPADYEEFWQRLEHGQEKEVRNREVEVKSLDDRRFRVETNINLVRNKQGALVSRIGVVRDLSKDEPLQRLRNDLGNVLHTFTTGLIAIKSDIESAQAALGVDPFATLPRVTTELILENMETPLGQLQRSTEKLVEALSGREEELRQPFEERLEQLEHAPNILAAFRAQAIRDMAHGLIMDCRSAQEQYSMPRQPLKHAREDAFDVMRVYALARLKERISDVLQMEHELRSLRSFVTGPGQSTPTRRSQFEFWPLVEQAMSNLHDFAASRGVEFRPVSHIAGGTVFAVDRDLLRVITNVLHNAIKYSWSRDAGIWIDILAVVQGSHLRLEIVNYGVPIPADELKSGLIFSFGYRSRVSTDKGRVGTGIGLADAQQTLRRFKGTVQLESRPASPGGEADGMDPFLTTAIVMMPLVE